jgi:hypothetical protein
MPHCRPGRNLPVLYDPGAVAITNSLGLVSSNPFSNAEAFTSLAGIAYPPSA